MVTGKEIIKQIRDLQFKVDFWNNPNRYVIICHNNQEDMISELIDETYSDKRPKLFGTQWIDENEVFLYKDFQPVFNLDVFKVY